MTPQELKQAGFSSDEIATHVGAQRTMLQDAGYSDSEVDEYFGIKEFDPEPIKKLTRAVVTEQPPPEPQKGEDKKERPPGIHQGEKPSLFKQFISYVTEPDWEQRRARAAISMTAARETGMPPHIFEPTTMDVLKEGMQQSVSGLLYRGQVPEGRVPEGVIKYISPSRRSAMQAATLAGDMPFMVAGAIIGGSGGIPTAFGGAFALPAGIRKVLMDKYEKGEIDSFGEFWKRLMGASYETLKGEAIGVATGAAGKSIPPMFKMPAEVTTMVTLGAALEGKVPEPQEFVDAAILIGGLHAAGHVSAKLRNIYTKTGRRPVEIIEDTKNEPWITEELLSDRKKTPYTTNEAGDTLLVTPETIRKIKDIIPEEIPVPAVTKLSKKKAVFEADEGGYIIRQIKENKSGGKWEILFADEFVPYLKTLLEDVQTGEAGARVKLGEGYDAEIIGFSSTYPEFMRNQPWGTKKTVSSAIEKALKGEELGSNQMNAVQAALEEAKERYQYNLEQYESWKEPWDVADDIPFFRPAEDFRRRKPIEGKGPVKPIKRSEIVNFLEKNLSVPIRTGRFWGKKRYLGIYKLKDEVVRTRLTNDIETIAHEIGHGLQKYLWPESISKGISGKPFTKFKAELEPLATKPKEGQSPLPEGFAEFIRLYVTDVNKAKQAAPKFFDYFEKLMDKKSPGGKEILIETRDMFTRWLEQSAQMRVLSQLSIGEKTKRPFSWHDLYTNIVDDLHPLNRAVKAMTKGENLEVAKDPYKLARLLRGWNGKAEHFLEFSPYDFKTYENKGKSLKEILTPVKDLDELRAYMVSKRALELHGRKIESGILKPDAEKIISDLGPKYEKVFKDIKEYQDHALNYLKDSGMLSPDHVKKMRQANQDYVPFYRVFEEKKIAGTGTGLEARQPIKKITGSWADIQDPLESIIKNTYLYINLAEKNAVGSALVRLAETREGLGKYVEKIPMPQSVTKAGLKEVIDQIRTNLKGAKTDKALDFEMMLNSFLGHQRAVKDIIKKIANPEWFKKHGMEGIEKLMEKAGLKTEDLSLVNETINIFRPSAFVPKDNVISVWRTGKRELYQVHPDIARAVQALDKESVGSLIKILAFPAKLLRAGATLSPEFIARNPVRDQMSAFIYSKYGFIPGYNFMQGVAHMVKKSDIHSQWLKGGGQHAMLVSFDRTYLQKGLKELLSKTPVRNVVKNPMEALRIFSELSEAGTRVGAFKKAVKKTGKAKAGIQEAAFESREITLDFARIGAKTKAMNHLIAFWNANVQGTDKMIRAFKDQPAMTTAKVIAGITIPSIILTAVNRQDPRWDEIPQWQKDLFWIIMTEKHIFRIPKPFEIGIIFGTGAERLTDFILDKDPQAFDGFIKSMGRGAAPGVIPTVAVPFIESFANRSLFQDRPLVSAEREKALPAYQYRPYTTEITKALGALLGTVPGLKTSPHISPAKMENFVRGWSGGLGIHALKLADLALKKAGVVRDLPRPTKTLSDIPFIKAFMVRYPSSSAESISNFYKNYEESERILQTAKLLARREFRFEDSVGMMEDIILDLNGVKEGLSNVRNFIHLIYANPAMNPDEKRQLIDVSYYQMMEIAKLGNTMYEEAKKVKAEIKEYDGRN